MDKPALPAQVTLNQGLLSVRADNSSLSQILHQVASSSGMEISGLQQDQRVFGIYGPGNPRDILSSLLQGAGYNFLLVGDTAKGAPRQLVLTTRVGAAGPPQPSNAGAQPDEDDDTGDNNDAQPDDNAPPPEENSPAPAPPDSAAPAQPEGEGRVKSPAEIIQELQRMRQQQQNPQ